MKAPIQRKYTLIFVMTFVFLLLLNNSSYSQNGFLDLYGPYFGQEQPGTEPRVFADGIISGKKLHATPCFSPDGSEIYWAELESDGSNSTIFFSKKINNQWTEPEIASFSSGYYADNPIFSPDGIKLFFNSSREYNGTSRERIWYVTRQNEGEWSLPSLVDGVINNYALHWQVSVDTFGNLYYGSDRSPNYGQDDIFCSIYQNNHFTTPLNLGTSINSDAHESMPYIDPQTRFILFCRQSNVGGRISQGIWFCRKLENEIWSEAINISGVLPEINGACPQITPDGKYLFFLKWENNVHNVYWVNTKAIPELSIILGVQQKKYQIPEKCQLYQNYPNPFNFSTNIRFDLLKPSEVSIRIYDLQGRLVKTLLYNQVCNTGSHHFTWNGEDDKGRTVSSGEYFYKMETGELNEINKMLFLK